VSLDAQAFAGHDAFGMGADGAPTPVELDPGQRRAGRLRIQWRRLLSRVGNVMAVRPELHRVVVVGGGVAGLEIATALGRRFRGEWQRHGEGPSVTLVDHDTAHVWKPMLHTIAAGTSDISQQQTPYQAQAHAAGFAFQMGEFAELDRTARELRLLPLRDRHGRVVIPERRVRYDTLIIAVGSRVNDFGTPGAAEYCRVIDSRRQANAFNREIRVRVAQCLTQGKDLSIGIVGGGATGVELAAELIRLKDAVVAYGGEELPTCLSVTLLEAGPRLLPAFPTNISTSVQRRLEALGVRVLTHTVVSSVTEDAFILDTKDRIPASLKVWAAGVKAPEFLAALDGLETTRGNQLVVTPSLCTSNDPHIFAVGDCSSWRLAGAERPLPPTAQVAHQEAQHLIRYLPDAVLHGRAVPPFRYRDFGALVSLADYDAFGSLGDYGLMKSVTFRGRLAHFSHVLLYRRHQMQLHGALRGWLLWLIDRLNASARPTIRMD
jgi:NADH dehydrogenase